MAFSNLSACSSDLSYSSRICLPGSCDSCTGSSWQVDDCPESCCEPPCCAPSCCTSAPRLTLLCAPVEGDLGSSRNPPGSGSESPGGHEFNSWSRKIPHVVEQLARVPQLLKPMCSRPISHKRSHSRGKALFACKKEARIQASLTGPQCMWVLKWPRLDAAHSQSFVWLHICNTEVTLLTRSKDENPRTSADLHGPLGNAGGGIGQQGAEEGLTKRSMDPFYLYLPPGDKYQVNHIRYEMARLLKPSTFPSLDEKETFLNMYVQGAALPARIHEESILIEFRFQDLHLGEANVVPQGSEFSQQISTKCLLPAKSETYQQAKHLNIHAQSPLRSLPAAKGSFVNRTEAPESHTAAPNAFQRVAPKCSSGAPQPEMPLPQEDVSLPLLMQQSPPQPHVPDDDVNVWIQQEAWSSSTWEGRAGAGMADPDPLTSYDNCKGRQEKRGKEGDKDGRESFRSAAASTGGLNQTACHTQVAEAGGEMPPAKAPKNRHQAVTWKKTATLGCLHTTCDRLHPWSVEIRLSELMYKKM
ncbi:hypothetical protein JEQ12_001842 [Ovis aries]|uniref:Uncharacterized protein n=1 Tax=Ovis aries TaxID=9940 RepID=A0A836AFY8_SHEEP|nr:hypothetical protein JEQ12_001842 [Ovis aries]